MNATSSPSFEGLVGQLVRLERPEFHDRAEGYLLEASDAWVLIHRASDRLDLDGYELYRTRDLTSVRTDARHLETLQRALAMKGIRATSPGPLDLSGTRALMESIQARFPVLVIHRERRDPHACEVGRVRLDSELTYTLHWLSPDAEWEPDDRVFRYEDVTCLSFGGEYEDTVASLAGEAPGAAVLED
jgi:hypothetical protein